MTSRTVEVYLDIDDSPMLAGQAWFSQRRGGPVNTVFAYAPDYLGTPGARSIDPHLPLVTGNQYVDGLPGGFQDCAPDRWGRNLIQKRHRARATEGAPRQLNDVDFLLGVSDLTRQGALRFAEGGTFVHPSSDVPRLVELPQLLDAADRLTTRADEFDAVKILLEAGSGSLGGARPKASVRADDERLLIAKFPHRSDEWDVMAWECVALDLAGDAGIDVPERQLVRVADDRHVLLLTRFDRDSDGHRVPYLSAMSLLEARDGDWHDYSEIVEALTDFGSSVATDLVQLYRRVAFSVAVHNTDDHLRNHGFLSFAGGWRLAPAFDINPNPDLDESRVTGIAGETARPGEIEALRLLASQCRLSVSDAESINASIAESVAGWRSAADRRGIPLAEQDRFAPVFERPFGRSG